MRGKERSKQRSFEQARHVGKGMICATTALIVLALNQGGIKVPIEATKEKAGTIFKTEEAIFRREGSPPSPKEQAGCRVSLFTSWPHCSKSCGTGYHTRKRKVVQYPAPGGQPCPHLLETETCYQSCRLQANLVGNGNAQRLRTQREKRHKTDCLVGAFSSWPICSQQCGTGTHTRRRKVLEFPTMGGKNCPHLLETETCNEGRCSLHASTKHISVHSIRHQYTTGKTDTVH